jgi:hypothetical protein
MHSKHNKGDINEPRAEEDEHQVMEDDPDDCALIEKKIRSSRADLTTAHQF